MTLSKIISGRQKQPPRVLLYGTEGIGKTTWATSAPSPIVIQTEDGCSQIDCDKFPLAQSSNEVQASLVSLLTEDHEYQTVVIDSMDWLERLIWDELCKAHNVSSIEKVDGGYGKGYTIALNGWRYFLGLLDKLRAEKQMAIVCVAHAKIERFEDPEASAYDRYSPRLNKHACGVVCEWADAVLFAGRKMRIQSEDLGFNKVRTTAVAVGSDGGTRILKTVGGPSCVAKNRFNLPAELPLEWSAFASCL
jgi:hypothetical protein